MKKIALTIALALVMGLGANAQNEEMFEWNNTAESVYDGSDLGMFDWSEFTDLFDQVSQFNAFEGWFSDFSLGDDRSGGGFDLVLPDHGISTDVNAPLGSGIALLLGMGGAYLFAKRRKEE